MSTEDIDRFLEGGGGKSAKFETMGDMVKGTVIDCSLQQQTSMDDNKPLFWDNGDPRMQLVIKLQTDERDPDIENDEGVRSLYAKGGNFEVAQGQGKAMKTAIADAVKTSGAKLREGGKLQVAYTGEGKKTNRGYAAPKLFTAKYEGPVSSVETSDLFD